MSRHARTRARQLAAFEQACVGAVYVIRANGADSGCGCPCLCCTGAAVTCSFNRNFLPDELNGVMTLTDYSIMVAEVMDFQDH